MRLNKLITSLLLILTCLTSLHAQEIETYLFPILPKQQNFLAGTMGELRSSHFHAGIDIKTGGKEGVPVLASKSGYISRIKISTGGYGHALYLQHEDGNTTVYAHLKTFEPALEAYLKKAQYEQKTYEIELFPEVGQFSYKRGEEIAKSGNTGGSTGPHLHFEIRDASQRVLNPLHYGFTQVVDNIPPILQALALEPKNADSRINNLAKRQKLEMIRNGYNYYAKDTTYASGAVGIELLGHDKLNGAANKNGISIMEVFVNGQLYYYQDIDKMSFATQRHILVHYPYDVKINKGPRYHRLYQANGNQLDFYKAEKDNGWLTVDEDSVYQVEINMYDPYKNKSTASFILKGKAPQKVLYQTIDFELDKISYEIEDNRLLVYLLTDCLKENNQELSLKLPGSIQSILPSYYLENTAVYVWDLSKGLPESILSCGPGLNIEKHQIIPNQNNRIEAAQMMLEFGPNDLFDTAYIHTSYKYENAGQLELFTIGPEIFPLKSSMLVSLTPKLSYDQERSHAYEVSDEGDFSFVGGEWSNDHLQFSTRSLADFTILTDSVAPTISRINNSLSFKIEDDLSGIASYEAYVNDEWVLLKYEYKKELVWIEWLDKAPVGPAKGYVKVTDQAGDTHTLNFNLK